MNNELHNFDLWLKSNKLSVNVEKTKYVIFKTSKKKINHNFLLHYENEILHQVNSIKFLGVYIDQNLTWKDHINHVSKKSLVFTYLAKLNYHCITHWFIPSLHIATWYGRPPMLQI